GVPQIEVTFDIDADGIVNVGAKDQATGKDQSITIAASSGLSSDEIETMIQQAEEHAEADKARKETIEATNHATSVVADTEKAMGEFKDQIDATEAKTINDLIAELRSTLAKVESGEVQLTSEEIKAKAGEIQQKSLKLFELAYKARAAANSGNNNSSDSSNSSSSSSSDAKETEYRDPNKKE
ncbi:hypothetical protein H4R33_006489, partial [Dimargaris cristalligena]